VTTPNQNPEQIARDQIDEHLAEGTRYAANSKQSRLFHT